MKQTESGKAAAVVAAATVAPASPLLTQADEPMLALLDINASLTQQVVALLELIEASLTTNAPPDQTLGAVAEALRAIVQTIEKSQNRLAFMQSRL